MILAVDIGNTRIKCAVFENNNILELIVFGAHDLFNSIFEILKKHAEIDAIVVASVGNIDVNAFDFVEHRIKIEWITYEFPFPFKNNYQTPTTLGIDRMILASGAVLQFPSQNRLVIDAGTCLTYDFIDNQDAYLGGAISLGLQMRYQSLRNFTSKLPLLPATYPENYIGSSTAESIHSGVVNGIIYEIEGFLKCYEADYSKFTIILTGGDALFLAKRLKNTIFANSNFLLESLNYTYQYKIKNV